MKQSAWYSKTHEDKTPLDLRVSVHLDDGNKIKVTKTLFVHGHLDKNPRAHTPTLINDLNFHQELINTGWQQCN